MHHIKMDKEFETKAYTIISEFMDSVNFLNKKELHEKFGVTEPILEEICECLDDYFGQKPIISLASKDIAFSGKVCSRPYIDVYEMNDAHTWGVECVIWVGSKAAEPILHVELFDNDGNLGLRYRYIGS